MSVMMERNLAFRCGTAPINQKPRHAVSAPYLDSGGDRCILIPFMRYHCSLRFLLVPLYFIQIAISYLHELKHSLSDSECRSGSAEGSYAQPFLPKAWDADCCSLQLWRKLHVSSCHGTNFGSLIDSLSSSHFVFSSCSSFCCLGHVGRFRRIESDRF